jgi:predicted enzyme related to lactoylglutathione lyase
MGNPFAHIELAADDVGGAKKFYKSVFDWQLKDMPMGDMTYTMIGVGKGVGGGMTPKMMGPQQPTAWLPYVEVADVAKSLAKAKTAGANVVVERTPIGENMGAFGVFIDPQGAALGLWEAAKKAPAKRAAAKKKPAKKAAKKKGKR